MKYLWFVLLLAGCSYQPNAVQIEIDSTFPADKQLIIRQALEDWSLKTDRAFNTSTIVISDEISTNTSDNCIKIVNQDLEETKIDNGKMSILGLTDTNYSTIAHPTDHVQAVVYLWYLEDDGTFAAVSRHEIGHALNLGHLCTQQQYATGYFSCPEVMTDPLPTIMSPINSASLNVVQPVDVLRFCELWGCPN